jgi:hypothetical protein
MPYMRFEIVIDSRAANALRIALPPLLSLANQVIE